MLRFIRTIIGFVMFAAAVITLVSIFMDWDEISFIFDDIDGFRDLADRLFLLMAAFFIPLVYLSLGLILISLPSSRKK